MKRRTFLKTVGTAAGGLALGYRSIFAAPDAPRLQLFPDASGLPRRMLGRTGRKISIIGFPGLALAHERDEKKCTAALHHAFELGVNYFDVAPAYGDGLAENRMGPGLQGIPRDKIFLACKTGRRDAAGARRELERSLERLKTDHFDLYQLHAMRTTSDVEQALGPNGALNTFLEAKEEGKVRWLGFSAHSSEAALALLKAHAFDTVMYPVNFIEHFTHEFDQNVVARARTDGAAVLAIKPMCAGSWPRGMTRNRDNWYRALEEDKEIELALRFTLSIDPVVAALPPAFLDLAEKAFAAARNYRPATEADVASLQALAGKYVPLFANRGKMAARTPETGFPANPHESSVA
jgi:aryl-alcohol dehydrogenase-like predicted oxidoreductase